MSLLYEIHLCSSFIRIAPSRQDAKNPQVGAVREPPVTESLCHRRAWAGKGVWGRTFLQKGFPRFPFSILPMPCFAARVFQRVGSTHGSSKMFIILAPSRKENLQGSSSSSLSFLGAFASLREIDSFCILLQRYPHQPLQSAGLRPPRRGGCLTLLLSIPSKAVRGLTGICSRRWFGGLISRIATIFWSVSLRVPSTQLSTVLRVPLTQLNLRLL
jgi:hypothetical protein